MPRIAKRGNIATLDDISKLSKLRMLELIFQNFSDVAPLVGSEIDTLELSYNVIDNVSLLHNMKRLTSFIYKGISQTAVDSLLAVPNDTIVFLNISMSPELTSIEGIGNLQKLKSIALNNTGIFDISPLTALPNLESIIISETPCWDFSPLTNMPNLKSVMCFSNERVGLIRELFGGAPPFSVN